VVAARIESAVYVGENPRAISAPIVGVLWPLARSRADVCVSGRPQSRTLKQMVLISRGMPWLCSAISAKHPAEERTAGIASTIEPMLDITGRFVGT